MAEHAAAILILALWFGGWGFAAWLHQRAEDRQRLSRIRALYPAGGRGTPARGPGGR